MDNHSFSIHQSIIVSWELPGPARTCEPRLKRERRHREDRQLLFIGLAAVGDSPSGGMVGVDRS